MIQAGLNQSVDIVSGLSCSQDDDCEARLLRKRRMDLITHLMENNVSDSDDDASFTSSKPFQSRKVYPKSEYSKSGWAVLLERGNCTDMNHKDGKYFRRRFRVPYPVFMLIYDKCVERGWWPDSYKSAPLKLKLLAVFRVLGRGGSFDNVYEGTLIHENTIRTFFHEFCACFSSEFFEEFVHPPTTEDEIKKTEEVYKKLGLPGCMGSTDCTHVKWDKCPTSLRAQCKGKEGFPTLVYSVIVDHHRRIQSSTASFYGSWNDKTVVKYDKHIMDIKEKREYSDLQFSLYDADGNIQNIIGGYVICDGGYHKWRIMPCPMKHPGTDAEYYWSKMVESVRKDAECTFGSLKQRFRVLRYPIDYHKQDQIDNVFFTCCILHNMLLSFDGLDTLWEGAMEGQDCPDDVYEEEYDGRMPQVVGEYDEHSHVHAVDAEDNILVEVDDNFSSFKAKLISHYAVAHQKNEVSWLTRS